jgi:hypothetical protein
MRYLLSTVRLALRDLWHERVLTACLLLSVSAILAPLLLLFGLKNGIIDTMRGRLLRDPSSREIYPKDIQARPFSDKWFTEMVERPEVEFVVPRLDVAGDLSVRLADLSREGDSFSATCEVAAKGDPRLVLLGLEAPDSGQVALTRSLAQKLGAPVGGSIIALIDRGGLSSPTETVTAPLVVSAIVEETVPADRAWLPLSFLVAVRDFREYLAVSEFGWPGTDEELAPRYDALLTLHGKALGRKDLMELAMKPPGLVDAREIDSNELRGLAGIVAVGEAPPQAVVWRAVGNLVQHSSARELIQRLAEVGVQAVVLPLVDPIPVGIEKADGGVHAFELIVLEEAEDSRRDSSVEAAEIRRAYGCIWKEDLFSAAAGQPSDRGEEGIRRAEQQSASEDPPTGSAPETGSPADETAKPTDSALRPALMGPPAEVGGAPEETVALLRATPVGPLTPEEGELPRPQDPQEPLAVEAPPKPDDSELPPSSEQAPQPLGGARNAGTPELKEDSESERAGQSDLSDESGVITITISDLSAVGEGEARLLVMRVAALGESVADRLEIPVKLEKRSGVPEGIALVDGRRGGQIRRALQEPVVYREDFGGFQMKRDRFRDFRLFAATLEDVAPLAREFEAMKIPVRHSAERIAQILELDANLTRLFWIVASAAAGAGFFGLVASFFAAVERKRKELGVLQLLGMPKLFLFAFPMLQSAFLSLAAFGLALFLFMNFADLINAQFATDLREGEAFCSLRQDHALSVLKATMGFGLVASLFAALRSSRIQPSEALRSE